MFSSVLFYDLTFFLTIIATVLCGFLSCGNIFVNQVQNISLLICCKQSYLIITYLNVRCIRRFWLHPFNLIHTPLIINFLKMLFGYFVCQGIKINPCEFLFTFMPLNDLTDIGLYLYFKDNVHIRRDGERYTCKKRSTYVVLYSSENSFHYRMCNTCHTQQNIGRYLQLV